MGRKIKSEYARTRTLKVRISAEHLKLMEDIRSSFASTPSQADITCWALEEFASRNFAKKIQFIPRSRPRWKRGEGRGRVIVIGKYIRRLHET